MTYDNVDGGNVEERNVEAEIMNGVEDIDEIVDCVVSDLD